jgi:hypothetical protein
MTKEFWCFGVVTIFIFILTQMIILMLFDIL